MSNTRHALVTGGAGFVGSHLVERLLASGWRVTVVDNSDPFYARSTKKANLSGCSGLDNFRLVEADIRTLTEGQIEADYDAIVHLAAKAGVRPSLEDPVSYHDVNTCGTQNLLELARRLQVRQFVFASSSSVYGVNPNVPWCEDDHVLKPISPYASTKISGELLGHVYSHLYGIRFIALRLFTVYGPRQRPDLAIHKFARSMLQGKAIPFFGDGSTRRDYTFVDDIVSGLLAAMSYTGSAYEIINLGNDRTVSLLEMVCCLEEEFGIKATLDHQADQPGDVPQTWANISKARTIFDYQPRTEFREGIRRFGKWLTNRAEVQMVNQEITTLDLGAEKEIV